jgi:hypothetical protein
MRRHGFTIMELLIAVSLTVLLMLLVGRLFTDTQRAVSVGISTGRVIENSRAIGDQLDRDFKLMVPPENGGFLVVVQNVAGGVRDDQVFFIKNAEGVHPMCPLNTGTFTNSLTTDRSRIWYGHAQRTLADGSGAAPVAGPARVPLGREELLLVGSTLTTMPGNPIYAANARADATVANYLGTLPGTVPAVLYSGLTDIAAVSLSDLTGTAGTLTALTPADYRLEMYRMSYANAGQRLRVNPTPSGASIASYQIAQQHGYFSEYVSDFAVDVAGDIDPGVGNPGEIDRETSGARQGSIIWYNVGTTPNDPVGLTAVPAASPAWEDLTASGMDADGAFVFQHTTATNLTARDTWPHMLRIRWRQHDARGEITSPAVPRLTDGIDNDSDGTTDENDEGKIPGRWFEQIVPVARP